jgi:signal transduction histidine kinase
MHTMTPPQKARAAFASAVVLLFLTGLASFVAVSRLLESDGWVTHTREVQTSIGDLDAAMLRTARARSAFVMFGSDDSVNEFDAAAPEISSKLQRLRELTRDNPKQQEFCSRLQDLATRRLALLQESIRLKREAPQDEQRQAEINRTNLSLAAEMTSLTQTMQEEERRLLEIRKSASLRLFKEMVVILFGAFILVLVLFSVQYRFLSAELAAREQAERIARDSEDSLRRLTGRLLQLQDAERRKFSRELHDSLGQYLVGAKMNLEMFAAQGKQSLFVEAVQLLEQSIAETRTISHLLHPPLLDEVGLSSAAKWYAEGFAQRSGIEVKIDLPKDVDRLPKPVALTLFRILQESLTNIHRHSESPKAEVGIVLLTDRVTLNVRDYGKGIAPQSGTILTKGTSAGVGLAGMRERMRELGGQLSIEPCAPGTLIRVSVPLPEGSNESTASAAD